MSDRSRVERLARELRENCRGELREDEPMAGHTHFGLGGPADLFYSPADLEDLARALPLVQGTGLPVLPLGGGTNMLVRSVGFRGLVICLTQAADQIEIAGEVATAQAGASLQVFSRRCQRAGRTGLEFGCGIPGTVGGAIWGNAGAWGGETLDRLIRLQGIDLKTGMCVELKQAEIDFGYRHTDLPEGLLVVVAEFDLDEADPVQVQAKMDEMLAQRRVSQPLWERNAGCMFKNPPGTSAGLLVDRAGCKGLRVGGIAVSEVHANFLVNLDGGSAEDALALVEQVRDRVFQEKGIELETEVRIVGEQGIENP